MKDWRFARGTLIAALLVVLPASSAWATHRDEAERAIAEAKAAHAKAGEAKAASAETAALIEQAEQMLPTRQYTKAVEIANKAREQDSFAYQQATSGGGDKAASQQAEQAIAAAEEARKKASSVGGEWRDTGKMIEEAQGLAKSGKFEEAVALAGKAQRQGELGYAQALQEKNAGFPDYVTKKQ